MIKLNLTSLSQNPLGKKLEGTELKTQSLGWAGRFSYIFHSLTSRENNKKHRALPVGIPLIILLAVIFHFSFFLFLFKRSAYLLTFPPPFLYPSFFLGSSLFSSFTLFIGGTGSEVSMPLFFVFIK